jgi:hypothetical protein
MSTTNKKRKITAFKKRKRFSKSGLGIFEPPLAAKGDSRRSRKARTGWAIYRWQEVNGKPWLPRAGLGSLRDAGGTAQVSMARG